MKDALVHEFVTQSASSKWGAMQCRFATAQVLEGHVLLLDEHEDRSMSDKFVYTYCNRICQEQGGCKIDQVFATRVPDIALLGAGMHS